MVRSTGVQQHKIVMKQYIVKVLIILAMLLPAASYGNSVLSRVWNQFSIDDIVREIERQNEEARYVHLDSTIGINSRFYLDKLACLESGGNYHIKNRYGYMGKYQFGKRTLNGLVRVGYLDLTKDEMNNFLHIPSVQERAIDALIRANNDYLNRYNISKYIGKRIGGVIVTKEGLLAASHLVGPYAVVHFCKTGSLAPVTTKNGVTVKKHDGNGVYLTEYIRKFS
jgi:hypothetical protein